MANNKEEHEAVTNFRNYLRIPTVHPNVNYDECVKFLSKLGNDLGLPVTILDVHPGKPIVIITLVGTSPELPSVVLNSHMDVVPVYPELWTHDPFGAEKDDQGNIYARGAQDMKCIGILYVETIRRYLKEGLKFKRTIHITFVPDEEIGGTLGVAKFVRTKEFKMLNVGLWLDEARVGSGEEFIFHFAERTVWQVEVICGGTAGHGSLLSENTAGEKIRYALNQFLEFREKEKQKLKANPKLNLGDVTTINLTILKGGVQSNVLPSELSATFDIRIAPDVDIDRFESMLNQWLNDAGRDVRLRFKIKNPKVKATKLDDSNPWWLAFKDECDKMKLKLTPIVSPGGTDGRFVRELGIPVFGFSPINNTPVLLHDHNEFVNEQIFIRGIDIYYNIVKRLASI